MLQEVHGLMLAHYAVRRLIHEAARRVDEDPDRLSFVHAVRVVRRRVETPGVSPSASNERLRDRVLDEILEERVASSRGQKKPRGVKRKMSRLSASRPRHGVVPQVGLASRQIVGSDSRKQQYCRGLVSGARCGISGRREPANAEGVVPGPAVPGGSGFSARSAPTGAVLSSASPVRSDEV